MFSHHFQPLKEQLIKQQENLTGSEIPYEDKRKSHHSQSLQHSGSPGNLGSPGRPVGSGSPEIKRGVMSQLTPTHDETSNTSQQDPKQDPDGSQPATIPDGSQQDKRNSHRSQNLQHSGTPGTLESSGSPESPESSGSQEIKRDVMYQPPIEHDEISNASQQVPKQCKTPDVHDSKQGSPTKPEKTPADSQRSTTTSLCEVKSDESLPADDQYLLAESGDENNITSTPGKLLARFRTYRIICEKSWFIVPVLTYLHLYEISFA